MSKDARLHWPAYQTSEIRANWPLRIWVDTRNAIATYGAEHHRLRRVLAPFFTTRRIRALTPAIEHITSDLLDELEKHAPGPVDLRKQFAWRLPLSVINIILGLPEDMTDELRRHVEAGMSTHRSEAEAAENARAYYALLNELIGAKRARPGDDLTSQLVQLHDAMPDQLSHQELLDSLMLITGAGHETTVDLLDQGVTNLLQHPAQLKKVLSGQASWEDAVEETLRHQPPGANVPLRYAVEEIHDEATGVTIPRGDAIVINLAAVGRDPLIHRAPHVFDVTRATRSDHTSFGHGVHYCLGAQLARMEAHIALSALFARFPGLAFADPATGPLPLESFICNGHRDLIVNLRQP
ncbi:cytochrome P450 [Streptomyces sp. NPDC002476]|uniref:cytochrome P450 n=1 Tax=Streptomyces sp. NPDC002476 TaxID=3364648 RepID=UPI00367E5C53